MLLKWATPLIGVALLWAGCGSTQGAYGDGSDPFLDRSAYLAFAPCSYTYIAPAKEQIGDLISADRWEGCVGPHSPSALAHEQWTKRYTMDDVIDKLGMDRSHLENERTKPKTTVWDDGWEVDVVEVTYKNDGRFQAYTQYGLSRDGRHGFMCHFNNDKIEPAGDRTMNGAFSLCRDAMDDMTNQLHDAKGHR